MADSKKIHKLLYKKRYIEFITLQHIYMVPTAIQTQETRQ